MTESNKTESSWEPELSSLIESFGTAAYLVSEENNDKAEELAAMSMCIEFVRQLLQAAEERGRLQGHWDMEEGMDALLVMKDEAVKAARKEADELIEAVGMYNTDGVKALEAARTEGAKAMLRDLRLNRSTGSIYEVTQFINHKLKELDLSSDTNL